MRQLLQKEDLWDLVQPPTVIDHPIAVEGPGEVEGAAPAAPRANIAPEVNAAAAAAAALSLVKRRNQALGMIYMLVKDEVVPNIAFETNPVECWIKL
jgi:hypothetical protein